jgi:benzoylformate decarboxylase
MYSIQALWTAAQHALPMVFIVMRNRRYAALQDFSSVFGYAPDEPVAGTELPELDFVALAKGQGIAALSVSEPDSLQGALTKAFAATKPVLIEVEVA